MGNFDRPDLVPTVEHKTASEKINAGMSHLNPPFLTMADCSMYREGSGRKGDMFQIGSRSASYVTATRYELGSAMTGPAVTTILLLSTKSGCDFSSIDTASLASFSRSASVMPATLARAALAAS